MPTTTSKASSIGFFPATTGHISLTCTSSPTMTASASATTITTQPATAQPDHTTIKATRSTDASAIPTIVTTTTTTSPELLLVINDGIACCVVGITACIFGGLIIVLIWERKRIKGTQGMC